MRMMKDAFVIFNVFEVFEVFVAFSDIFMVRINGHPGQLHFPIWPKEATLYWCMVPRQTFICKNNWTDFINHASPIEENDKTHSKMQGITRNITNLSPDWLKLVIEKVPWLIKTCNRKSSVIPEKRFVLLFAIATKNNFITKCLSYCQNNFSPWWVAFIHSLSKPIRHRRGIRYWRWHIMYASCVRHVEIILIISPLSPKNVWYIKLVLSTISRYKYLILYEMNIKNALNNSSTRHTFLMLVLWLLGHWATGKYQSTTLNSDKKRKLAKANLW